MERHGTSQEEVVIIKQQKRHRLIHHSYNKNRIYYSVFAIFIIEIYIDIHVMSHQIISVDTHGTSIAKLVKSELPAPKKHPFLGQPSGPQQFLAI